MTPTVAAVASGGDIVERCLSSVSASEKMLSRATPLLGFS
jgi:hypothetical protein